MKIKLIALFLLSFLLISSFVHADTEQVIDTTKNVITSAGEFIGSVCDNGNWFFRPLVGSECTKDLQFLLMFILWGAFVFLFYDAIATYSAFSNLTSIVIGFGLAVILANIGAIRWLAEIITGLLTTPAEIGTLIAISLIFLIFYVIAKTMMISEKKRKKEVEVEQSKKEVVEISKAINKGIGS